MLRCLAVLIAGQHQAVSCNAWLCLLLDSTSLYPEMICCGACLFLESISLYPEMFGCAYCWITSVCILKRLAVPITG